MTVYFSAVDQSRSMVADAAPIPGGVILRVIDADDDELGVTLSQKDTAALADQLQLIADRGPASEEHTLPDQINVRLSVLEHLATSVLAEAIEVDLDELAILADWVITGQRPEARAVTTVHLPEQQ